MELTLQSAARKFGAALVGVVVIAAYLFLSVTQFVAAHLGESSDPVRIKKAIWLDPTSAEYRDSLGKYELLARQSPQTALPWLESATKLNPHEAVYWIDLAIAQQALGSAESENRSLRLALDAASRNPDIVWIAANLYVAQNASEDALQQFRIILENQPPLRGRAIDTCWRIRPDADYLLDQKIIPQAAYSDFLSFLISRNETAAAATLWHRIFSSQQSVERQDLFGYLRYLIFHQEIAQADRVWQQAANLAGLASYQRSSQNLLVNGDFSLEVLNAGFDWAHQKTEGVILALDPGESQSSSRSLRIIFDGPGINDAGVAQIVPVEPNTAYEFSASYKAEEMDGAGGMEFAVNDAYGNTPFLMSDDLRDTESWKEINGSFITGPDTQAVVVHLVRVPSGSPIRGKLWIDGLRLVRALDRTLSSQNSADTNSADTNMEHAH